MWEWVPQTRGYGLRKTLIYEKNESFAISFLGNSFYRLVRFGGSPSQH